MSEHVDVAAFARLARLEVSEEELKTLETELPQILEFVDSIQGVEGGSEINAEKRNVLREDTDPHEPGAYTDVLLKAAPQSRDGYVVVKQVLSKK